MQSVGGGSHEAIEQRAVEAVEVLQSVEHAELGAQIEMKRGMADGSKVDENHTAMGLLERDRGIDGSGSAPGASLGAEESKHPRLARARGVAGAGGTEAGESFEQRFRPGGVIEIFARS